MTLCLRLCALSAVVLAGCGSNQVGGGLLNGFKETTPSSNLGAAGPSPSATAPAATATPAPAHTAAPVQTARPAATPRPTQAAPHFAISINSDTGSSQFDPPVAQVPRGTIVTWTNHDSVARSVVADNNAFNSGPIAPGASWSWTASVVGQVGYHDGTRPYAVASLQVTAT